EVRSILQHIPEGATYLRMRAVIAVLLHGFRAKEARTMLRRNVVLPARGELMGDFILDRREQTKSDAGVRVVPMEPLAKDPILRYLHSERPAFSGEGDEPLFLTVHGKPMSEETWNSVMRRLRKALVASSVDFRQ